MYATTKQELLQFEYLKMRSIYFLMLKAGTSDPWNIVMTSFIFDALTNFSFFWIDLSRIEERTDKTRGFPEGPAADSSHPKVEKVSEITTMLSSAPASMSS